MVEHVSEKCIVCASQAHFYCTKEPANYYRCAKCGLIFQCPLPTLQDMIDYANQEYAEGGLYADYVSAAELKYATFRRRMKIIKQFSSGGKLLDVGAACGYFVDVALEAGFDAYGIEFSEAAIATASEQARPRIMQGDVNALDTAHAASYDVISAYDILEHTLDPLGFLDRLGVLLKPGGFLIIATPDTGHFLRPLMGERWTMLQPSQHTFLFSKPSLQTALQTVGFTNIHVMPTQKVLTPEYLAGQLRTLNPLISKSYNTVSRLLPHNLRHMPIGINIGEILAYAQK